MRAQLSHLMEVSELPNVTFQVIPFDVGAHAGMPGFLIVLQFAEEAIPDVIYVDGVAGELMLEGETVMFGGINSCSNIFALWLPAQTPLDR